MSGSVAEIFWVAFKLGISSFGGPLAHLGYFERTYVRKQRWLTLEELARLIALCQALPGPTSSQVGFLIGQRRAGLPGALAAWLGFTLPSALLMVACALWSPLLPAARTAAVVTGLKWVTVMVVAQAVWQMARVLCTDGPRMVIAALTGIGLLLTGGTASQLISLALAAAFGAWFVPAPRQPHADRMHSSQPPDEHMQRGLGRLGLLAFLLFTALLAACLCVLALDTTQTLPRLVALLYRAGALVFGGGHLVLPLLHDVLVPSGWTTNDAFLAGYGAAQALPGPLFTFSAYLGALLAPPGSAASWAMAALLALFAPGLLLALAAVPLWNWLEQHRAARSALAGINAGVVGLLASALINPVGLSAVHDVTDLGIVLAGFAALQRWRVAPIVAVAVSVLLALGRSALA